MRHKKCGEERPQCLRCIEAGFKCDYELIRKHEKHLTRDSVSSSESTTLVGSNTLPQTPRATIFDTDSEYHYFMSFQNRPRGYLSGDMDKKMWRQIAQQGCHQEGFVKYAFIALAAFEKAISVKTWSVFKNASESSLISHKHTGTAFKYYSKALQLLREYNRYEIDNEYRLRNTLLSCLLIATFENYLGNIGNTLKTMVHGLAILSQFAERRFGKKLSIYSIPSSTILDADFSAVYIYSQTILILFTMNCLAPHANASLFPPRSKKILSNPDPTKDSSQQRDSGISTRRVNQEYVYISDLPSNYPDIDPAPFANKKLHKSAWQFQSLAEARSSLDNVYSPRLNDFKSLYKKRLQGFEAMLKRNAGYGSQGADNAESVKTTPSENEVSEPTFKVLIDTEIKDALDRQVKELSNWESTYITLFEDYRKEGYQTSKFQDATTLMIKYLAMRLSIIPPEMEHPSYRCIRRILFLAREIIDPPVLPPRTEPVVFASGQSIANDIRLCVTSCRDNELRKEAIELMYKHPRGDGLWDAVMIAKLAEFVLRTEADYMAGRDYFPEGKAVMRYVYESELLSQLSGRAPILPETQTFIGGFRRFNLF